MLVYQRFPICIRSISKLSQITTWKTLWWLHLAMETAQQKYQKWRCSPTAYCSPKHRYLLHGHHWQKIWCSSTLIQCLYAIYIYSISMYIIIYQHLILFYCIIHIHIILHHFICNHCMLYHFISYHSVSSDIVAYRCVSHYTVLRSVALSLTIYHCSVNWEVPASPISS
jgi:hypothetical protein